jgi:hypothetical protein
MNLVDVLLDGRRYIESFLKIKTKDARIVPFRLNEAQGRLYDALMAQDRAGQPMRAIILKARQLGFSTMTEGLIYSRAATRENQNALIVAHRDDATKNVFEMAKRFYDNSPAALRPMRRASNAQEIVFGNPDRNEKRRRMNPGLNSRIRCVTAGGGGIGRSDTLQMVHASEFAFWPGDKKATWIGIMQAVPAERGTLVVIESTANGFDEFHTMWEAAVNGESDFLPLFFPWYENPDYRRPAIPDTEWTAEEIELRDRLHLDDEQLTWRRWCIKNNCAGDVNFFRQEYPATPEEAFLTSGRPVFEADLIAQRLRDVPEPVAVGSFRYESSTENPAYIGKIEWVEREDGGIRIYQEPRPGYPYVIGGDTAGEGSDWFTAQVMDNVTGRTVATLRMRYDEDLYARQMYCLGRHFNWALLGIEVNFSTYPVKLLTLMHYPKLYLRQIPDTYQKKFKKAFGWETNSRTRPAAIAGLVQAFREDPDMVTDRQTLMEMRSFQRNADGRPEAIDGEHDDLVMALAITNAIREQQTAAPPKGKRKTDGWTADMWADYRRADAATREYLMNEWGSTDA